MLGIEPGCTLYVLHRAEAAATDVYMDGRVELMRLREVPA